MTCAAIVSKYNMKPERGASNISKESVINFYVEILGYSGNFLSEICCGYWRCMNISSFIGKTLRCTAYVLSFFVSGQD